MYNPPIFHVTGKQKGLAYLGRPARYSATFFSPISAWYPSGVSREAAGALASGLDDGRLPSSCM